MTPDVADPMFLVWPQFQRPPAVELPDGYAIRTYREDDNDAVQDLLQREWPLDAHTFREFLDHVLPNGLFLVETRESGDLVGATAAVHNPEGGRHHFAFGGEVAYLYVADGHRRQGIGRALAAAAVRRLNDAGYTSIRVSTTNPGAIMLFLDLAFLPFSPSEDEIGAWRQVYDELGLPFDRKRVVTP